MAIIPGWLPPRSLRERWAGVRQLNVLLGRVREAHRPGSAGAPLVERPRTTAMSERGDVRRSVDNYFLYVP
jgi:hypothetical protein